MAVMLQIQHCQADYSRYVEQALSSTCESMVISSIKVSINCSTGSVCHQLFVTYH